MRNKTAPGVLLEIGVGLNICRVFDIPGPAHQGVIHILRDLWNHGGLNVKYQRNELRPFQDNLGHMGPDKRRQLGPQRAALARPRGQHIAAPIVFNLLEVVFEWLFKNRHGRLPFFLSPQRLRVGETSP